MNAISAKMGRVAVLVTALVTVAGCASTPKTFANADRSVDFANYQSFAYVEAPATDRNDYASLETTYLKTAISDELESRGLVESNSPDLLINFHVHTQEKLRSHSVPSAGGFGYYDPFFDTWGVTAGYHTEVRQYTEGTLTIDIVDAQSNRIVWEGAAVGRVTNKDKQNLEEAVNGAVAEIMKDYPVVPANS